MSIKVKPYLKEVDALYEKIMAFESAVHLKHAYNPVENVQYYMDEDVHTVIDALSGGMGFKPGELGEIKNALHSGDIDFMRLVRGEEMPEEEYQLLYIMSRPFFKSMKSTLNMDDMFWEDGRCPVCSANPALSVIEKESQRKYVCSFCGTSGSYMRIGCPSCLTDDPGDITIITLEGEEGMRADTCEKCRSYVKTFEGTMAETHSMYALDIMSIPIDIIVQEKGFRRHSPNPVGIMKLA